MTVKKIKRLLKTKETILMLVTLAIVLGFFINNKYYLSLDSLRGTMISMSITGIMAVGVALLFIGKGIDLSMSMACLFGGVSCALLMRAGIPWPIAIVITLIIGACIGGIHAFMIAKLGMMPFIATIAMANVLQGVNLTLTNAQNVTIADESFYWGSTLLVGIFPVPFVIMIILLLVYGVILSKTQFGRNIYLVGGNEQAARLAGVSPVKTRSVLYINAGVMSTFSGVVLASRMRTASPSSLSDNQMTAITAAILGGIAFTGGSGGMTGCFIGILMLSFFNTGLSSLALKAYWTTIASGLLLILALTVDFFNERSRAKSLRANTDAKGVQE